jgi:hypothetical protein
VIVQGFRDTTVFHNDSSLTEHRTSPRLGEIGSNLLVNPALFADKINGIPIGVDVLSGKYTFSQVPSGGCRMKQTATSLSRLRFKSVQHLNHYQTYSLCIVGRNYSGNSVDMYLDIGGTKNVASFVVPKGNEVFTHTITFSPKETTIVDLVVYKPVDLLISSMYLIPSNSQHVPYGSEVITASKLNLGRFISYSSAIPTSAGQIGDLVLCLNPVPGGYLGWTYTSKGWKSFGAIQK